MQYKNATPQKQADGTYVLRYQVVDAANNPVGQPSVFTGTNEAECYQKAVQAHQTATAAIERLRKRQPTYKPGTADEAITLAADAERKMREAAISYEWMQSHMPGSGREFFRCAANADILKTFLDDNGLEWTVDNLELAFDACENRLAKSNKPVTSETPEEILPPVVKTPWSDIKNRDDLRLMPRERYRELLFSPKYSSAFKEHILAIQGGN
jgi:hypothetical protein